MALRLSQFDFEIEHRPGVSNIADYYSRHPIKAYPSAFLEEVKTEQYINLVTYNAMPMSLTRAEVSAATSSDIEMQILLKRMRLDEHNRRHSKIPDSYKYIAEELNATEDGILLRGQRIIIPISLRARVVELADRGHQGIVKTKSLIRSRVWFPGIDKHVEDKVKTCKECQACVDRPTYEPMRASEMPDGSWQKVSGDFNGPMSDGNYWFVNHCEYSRWVTVDLIKSCSMESIQPVLEQLFRTFGVPFEYKTDNGSPFQSYKFAEFAESFGVLSIVE